MASLSPILLPALFGLFGTFVGGFLTMTGQVWAERRAEEKRGEEHYSATATEMILWINRRWDFVSSALASSGQTSREFTLKVQREYPLDEFFMRSQSAFPELLPYLQAYFDSESGLLDTLLEIADEDQPFSRHDIAAREKLVEKSVAARHPLMGGLAAVRAHLAHRRPKRLKSELLIDGAEAASREVHAWSERAG